MASNALSPAFVRIFYHSAFGVHTMTRPTRAWSVPAGGFLHGSFLDWADTPRDADDMIKDFVNTLAPLFSTDVSFDNYIIYTQADAESFPLIVNLGDLSIDGTSVADVQEKASQATYSFLDTEGKKAKIVLLDNAVGASFEPKGSYGALSADEQDMAIEFLSSGNGWASRNDARPNIFRQATFTLNDGLRKRYRMT